MSGEENTEVSVAEAYCVVYTLDDKEWVVTGEGWAQVHLYRDTLDDTFRIVGWTVQDSQVVINSNVTYACKYKKKSADFHKFVDEEERTFGFGFYKKDDSFNESESFMKAINDIIESENQNPPEMPMVENVSSGTTGTTGYMQSTSSPPQNTTSKATKKTGKLQIFNPKPGRAKNIFSTNIGKKKKQKEIIISDPFSIEHKEHVRFDETTRTFIGLPDEWEASINKQFGLPLGQVKTVKVEGYVSKIPLVLVTMREYFISHGGLKTEGVFRVAPDSEECSYIKDLLNKGKFDSCNDIHCMSNLIKLFFRELPGSVLSGVNPETIIECKKPETAAGIIGKLDNPHVSVLRWLLDLFLEVADNSASNKMTEQALAIVLAPNLFQGLEMAITLQLVFAPKAASFIRLALEERRTGRVK